MIALRITVDHPRPVEEALVLELLGERRLARPERPDAQHRRVPVALRTLPDVEAHRLTRARQRVAEVEAAVGPDEMGCGRHHRGHLLGREGVVVAREPRPLTGQMLQEQLQLVTERPVQANLAEGAAAHLDAPLELSLVGGSDGDHERRPQQRRATGGLQVGQQVPRFLGALEAEIGGALLPVGLRPQDLVGVLDAAPGEPESDLVGQEACVQGHVDRERQAFCGREHQLCPRAREVQPLGQGAKHEMRLPAAPALRLDHERASSVLHDPVGPAHQVALERREHCLSVALEGDRPRLVQAVHHRFADAATEAAPDQPLELHHARRPHVEEVRDPRVCQLGGNPRALEFLHRHETPGSWRERPAQVLDQSSGVLRGDTGEEGGHVPLGLAQAGEDEQDRLRRLRPLEPRRLPAHVVASGVGAPGDTPSGILAPPIQVLLVAVRTPAPADAHDLQVGGQSLERAHETHEARVLLGLPTPGVRARLDPERGPAVIEPAREHAVPVDERDRSAHRC